MNKQDFVGKEHNIFLVKNRREIIKWQKTGIETEASVSKKEDILGKAAKIILINNIRKIIKT